MKMSRWVTILAFGAAGLAVAASVALLFLPVYSGTSVDAATGKQIATHSTLLQVNGSRVLIPLLIPLVLVGLGVFAVRRMKRNDGDGRLALWLAALALAVYSVLTGFSIGEFFAPAALMMLAAAVLARRSPETPTSSD